MIRRRIFMLLTFLAIAVAATVAFASKDPPATTSATKNTIMTLQTVPATAMTDENALTQAQIGASLTAIGHPGRDRAAAFLPNAQLVRDAERTPDATMPRNLDIAFIASVRTARQASHLSRRL